MSAEPWQFVLPPAERAIYEAGGHGASGGSGDRPALLVVDVTYAFTGDRDEDITASMVRFPLSCGPAAWKALPRIAALAARFRAMGHPVIYTCPAPRRDITAAASWSRKNERVIESSNEFADRIHVAVEPEDGDAVVVKEKPSAFFGTPLVSTLHARGVDCLYVAGTSTSGCVRATVVDAFSYEYPITVVADCTFDRTPTSHRVALYEMHAKYADVRDLADVRLDEGHLVR